VRALSDLAPIAFVAIQSGIIVFYWTHCILPAQRLIGAYPRTLLVIQSVGAMYVIAVVIGTSLSVDGRTVPVWLIVLQGALAAWYLSAWPRPQLVARISGGSDPREGLRMLLWQLNAVTRRLASDPDDDASKFEAAALRARLAALPRTEATTVLIDLWLEDADRVLEGSPYGEEDQDRRAAIWSEALTIWPDPEIARVVAPYREARNDTSAEPGVAGGQDSLEPLRLLLWRVNSGWRDVADDRGGSKAQLELRRGLAQLRRSSRTETTSRLIDLWLAEGESVLRDNSADEEQAERLRAIWLEARRVWPDFSVGRVAAPFSSVPTDWPDDPTPAGGEASLEPLRILLWQISADWGDIVDDVAASSARPDLERELEQLRALPQTDRTRPIIDLWLAEGEAILRDRTDDAQRADRLRRIWAEARRLWPEFTIGRVAAPAPRGPRDWPAEPDSAPSARDVSVP
jgi:hypothetical protein